MQLSEEVYMYTSSHVHSHPATERGVPMCRSVHSSTHVDKDPKRLGHCLKAERGRVPEALGVHKQKKFRRVHSRTRSVCGCSEKLSVVTVHT